MEWGHDINLVVRTAGGTWSSIYGSCEIVDSAQGCIALERSRTGHSFVAAQQAIVNRHDELIALNSQQARSERAFSGGKLGRTDKFIPTAIRDLAKLPDVEQATQPRDGSGIA